MTDPDTLLAGLWAEDEPPARDPAFVAATMQAAARRRFRRQLLALAPTTVAAAAVAWSAAPFVTRIFAQFDPSIVGPAIAAVVLAGLVGLGTGFDMEPAPAPR
jgi:hypothetical protein